MNPAWGTAARSPGRPSSAQALAALRTELAASGVTVTGMTLTRLNGTLTLPGDFSVTYLSGWLWWQPGRLSSRGRPLHAIHPAGDPVGATRRIVALLPRDARPASVPAQAAKAYAQAAKRGVTGRTSNG